MGKRELVCADQGCRGRAGHYGAAGKAASGFPPFEKTKGACGGGDGDGEPDVRVVPQRQVCAENGADDACRDRRKKRMRKEEQRTGKHSKIIG